MSEGPTSRRPWQRFAFWAIACIAATSFLFASQDGTSPYLLIAAISIMLVSPFIAIGSLAGYPRAGLLVGLVVISLYLFVFFMVNFGGLRL